MKKLIITLLIGILITSFSEAQQNTDTTETKRWSIAWYLGWTIGGPCIQFYNEMVYCGFNDYQSFLWFGGKDHPHTNRAIPSWLISCSYKLNSSFSNAILVGKSNLGTISGFNAEESFYKSDHINIENTSGNFSAIFSYDIEKVLSIGIGPALYNVKTTSQIDSYGQTLAESIYNFQRVGFIVDLKIQVPQKSQFYFELNGQFRYVGKGTVGPFLCTHSEGIPEIEINYNHGFIGGAFGYRF